MNTDDLRGRSTAGDALTINGNIKKKATTKNQSGFGCWQTHLQQKSLWLQCFNYSTLN
jgi:hypothetical protein